MFILTGLLMAVAAPRVKAARERAVVAAMKSDLRNLAVAQESYFYDTGTYSADVALLRSRGFEASGKSSVVINEATAIGWSATVTHLETTIECYLFVGAAAPVGSAAEDGAIDCS